MSRREAGFRNGLRVRVDGVKGVLTRIDRRTGTGHYWKIHLQTDKWVWPDDFAVDGPGDERHARCEQCGLPYYTRAGSGEMICANCDREMFGTAVRAHEPDPPREFEDIPGPRRGVDRHRRPWHS
jgi:hypothetical protein